MSHTLSTNVQTREKSADAPLVRAPNTNSKLIAFHVAHPKNTFIIAETLGPRSVKLFRGSRIMELVACGFKLEACCLGLDACGLELEAC